MRMSNQHLFGEFERCDRLLQSGVTTTSPTLLMPAG
jgi:hypothetical protein